MDNPKTYDVDILRRIEDQVLNDETLARDAKILNDYTSKDSEVCQFYKDKCILVTGGTGFLGKVLIEKLLRSCPDIRVIFLLIRKKKGVELKDRIDKFFQQEIFKVLESERPHFRKKVVPIEGDFEMPNLGMTNENRELIKNQVSIIFNVAALVRFHENFKKSIKINIVGTLEMLKLASGCQKLESFVHFSTAYAHSVYSEIEEKFYDAPIKPIDLLNMSENISEEELEKNLPRLLGKYPNIYIYTKAVSEDVVREYGKGLPVSVIRPSIVVGTYREPIRGWIDNLYGPTGVIVATGLGLMRTFHVNPEKIADLVPADMVANCAIVNAWQTAQDGAVNEPRILNYVAEPKTAITWGQFCEKTQEYGLDVPTVKAVWCPSLTLNKNWYVHMLYVIFLHFLPGLVIDFFCKLTGKEARLYDTCKKLYTFNDVLSYFSTSEWKFSNDNVQKLYEKLSPIDKHIFLFDMKLIDWNRHAEIYCTALRVYFLKDPMSTLKEAKKKHKMYRRCHMFLKYFFIILGFYLISLMMYKILGLIF